MKTIIGSIAGAVMVVAFYAYDKHERNKDEMDINKRLAETALVALECDGKIMNKYVNEIDVNKMSKLIEDKNMLICKFMNICNTKSYRKSKEVHNYYYEYELFRNDLDMVLENSNINKQD